MFENISPNIVAPYTPIMSIDTKRVDADASELLYSISLTKSEEKKKESKVDDALSKQRSPLKVRLRLPTIQPVLNQPTLVTKKTNPSQRNPI